MADYYPLLAKAVAGLPNSTLEARRAIYERARKALFGQLRSLDPPVPEAVIEREARDLEAAVARLEAEIASQIDSGDGPGDVGEEGSVASPPRPSAPLADDEVSPPGVVHNGTVVLEPAEEVEAAAFAAESPMQDTAEQILNRGNGHAGMAAEVFASESNGFEPTASETFAQPGAGPLQPPGRARPEAQRPIAPVAKPPAAPSWRLWFVGATVALVVLLVAIAAYLLRDRPSEMMARQPAAPQSASDTAESGKIVDRIGSGEAAPEAPQIAPKKVETVRNKVEPVVPPSEVARRAALLIEAPEEQAKVKTVLGTVLWRLDNVSNGPGEPLSLAVRAEIEIPEEKLQAAMTFQKNTDATLPASHTIKLRFVVPPGSPLGGIKQISVPQMRKEETANGESLNGVPVPVMENSFLVGLARGSAEAGNLELIRSKEWFDVPMLLANGRIAKLTFEKGTAGQAAIDDALASWQAQ